MHYCNVGLPQPIVRLMDLAFQGHVAQWEWCWTVHSLTFLCNRTLPLHTKAAAPYMHWPIVFCFVDETFSFNTYILWMHNNHMGSLLAFLSLSPSALCIGFLRLLHCYYLTLVFVMFCLCPLPAAIVYLRPCVVSLVVLVIVSCCICCSMCVSLSGCLFVSVSVYSSLISVSLFVRAPNLCSLYDPCR